MTHEDMSQNAEGYPTVDTPETEIALGKGIDLGTANIAAAVQNEEGGITVNVERNAFLDIGDDVYSKNMLTKLKVPYVVHNGKLIVIGESAFELANVFGKNTRRPMSDGLISPAETDALPIMKMIISKVLGQPAAPGESCYFSVPAESLDVDNNVIYHQGLFASLLGKMGYSAKPINEAHAVVFAELADSDFTGILKRVKLGLRRPITLRVSASIAESSSDPRRVVFSRPRNRLAGASTLSARASVW